MNDAAYWDDRYRTDEFIWRTEPNQFLPAEVAALAPGSAVDLACGEGRNAVWLAMQGWDVTGIDFSEIALTKGADLARSNDVDVHWQCADATTWRPSAAYDLVVVFYLHLTGAGRSAAFASAARALAPGGTLLIVGHDLRNLTDGVGGPQDQMVLYTPDDVRGDLERSGLDDLVVERADRVERTVTTADGPSTAIDCLVRASRPPRT